MKNRAALPRRVRAPRSQRLLGALGIMLTLATFGIGSLVIVQDRQETWAQARISSENLLVALQRDLTRNFELLKLSLQGAVEALAEPGLEKVSPGIFYHAVFDRSASTEEIASFVVINREGWVTHRADGVVGPPIDVSDREYFRVHRDNPDLETYFSNVYRSRLRGGEATIGLSRRLDTPDGHFAGVVLGTIATRYFGKLFQNLELGTNGSLSLFTTSGRLVHRQPFKENEINRDLSGSVVVQRMLTGSHGQFVGRSTLDGIERLFTFARIDGVPLILAVNRSVNDIYAGWWHRAVVSTSVLVALCSSSLLLTALFYRELRRRGIAEAKLRESATKLELIASTDSLTGLGNRRTMLSEINREWKRAIRSANSIAFLMIDVDHFKLFNDHYGHPEGDRVLRIVAGCIRDAVLRPTDTVSRYGGEEFVVLLGETETTGACAMAEKIRAAIEAHRLPHAPTSLGFVSVSIGVAVTYPTAERTPECLLKEADLALYEAKRAGRNRTSLFSATEPVQAVDLQRQL